MIMPAAQESFQSRRWQFIRRRVIQRLVAIVVGILLLLVPAFLFEEAESAFIYFSIQIAIYSLAGVILGFTWPDMGWRSGVWLYTIWPFFVLGIFALSDRPPVIRWKEELISLIAILLILPAASAGGWFGAALRTRISRNRTLEP